MSASFTDKRVLVTGSGTGIGREIALEFARAGADVVVHYSSGSEGAQAAVQQIQEMGRRTLAIQADFSDAAQAQKLGEAAIAFLGGLDVLVNNAGITWNKPFEQVNVEQFDRVYSVNVRSPFFLTQKCVPSLVESRGTVINLTSIHAFAGFPEHAVYAGTKGAIVAMTRELAIELAPRGVRVNAIAPGSVMVDNYYKVDPNFDPKKAGRTIPAGFIGEPSDIAKLTLFLASDDARFIVGQTIISDGGTTSWMPFSEAFREGPGGQFGQGYMPGA